MIELTDDQRRQLESGQAVDVTEPQTAQAYVLLPKQVYERLRNLVYDDSEWTAEEMQQLLARSAETNGWNEPGMDAYDRYDEERAKRCP
jgi:hypothetical protein